MAPALLITTYTKLILRLLVPSPDRHRPGCVNRAHRAGEATIRAKPRPAVALPPWQECWRTHMSPGRASNTLHPQIWKSMSEADRVFSRHKQERPATPSQERQLVLSAPRRNGSGIGKSRIVEVVHVSRDRASPQAEQSRPVPRYVRAETWPDGFHARSAAPLPAHDPQPAAPGPAPDVGHLMPGWQPLLPPAGPATEPGEASAEVPLVRRRQKRDAISTAPKAATRHFADPFVDHDTGANCRRCGYLIEPAREARGLTRCARCG